MKDDLELNGVDLEQLLRSKTWSQLSEAEQKSVSEIVSGREEYDRLYAMVHQLKTTTGVHDSDLIPSGEIRENLLMAFDEEQRRKRTLWWSGMGFWLRDQLRLDIPAVRLGLAGVLLAVGVFTAWKIASRDQAPMEIANTNPEGTEQKLNRVSPGAAPKHENENMRVIGDSVLTPVLVFPWAPSQGVAVEDNRDEEVVEPQNNSPEPVVDVQNVATPDSNIAIISGGNDSLAVQLPTIDVFPTNGNLACCGTGVTLNATSGTNYIWTNTSDPTLQVTPTFTAPTNSNIANVYMTVPNCRSLANDKAVIATFYSLK